MRAPRHPVVFVVLWLLMLAAAPRRADAQEKVSSAGAPAPEAPAEPAPQTAPVEAARGFAVDAATVRTALLGLLQDEAFPLTPEPSGEIVTEFTYFAPSRFGRSVATAPPKVSPTFPFYQTNEMQTGKARLHASIEPNGAGSRVRVEALLMSPAFNRLTYERAEIPRQSNGTIERYFLDKLEERLSAGKPQTAPSH